MIRRLALLVVGFSLLAVLLPSEAFAWHWSSAYIDDVRYANTTGGVQFSVDFRIWDHVGDTGMVRIRITDGIDTVVARRTFRPGFDPAQYRGFSVYISNSRLAAEGRFFAPDNLKITVDILDAGRNLLASYEGWFAWIPMRDLL